MEATAVSIGKAVLNGALGYAKSKAAEEMALQLGVEDDVSFITDELEMMQSFLMAADEERAQSKVLTTWVKQVRDVTYNVEDNLVDFEIHAEREKPPFLGCISRNTCHRRRIAMEVKKLKAKVEDVSNRNLRYRLIKDGAGVSKPAATVGGVDHGGVAGAAAAAMFGVDEAAWRAVTEQEIAKADLSQLIINEAADLKVIAVWGTSSDLWKTSEIRKVYDDPKVKDRFGCRAWVRLMHPFDPKEFLQSFVRQFYVNSYREQGGETVGAHVLLQMEKMEQTDLVDVFKEQVSSNRYLIVINDLTTIEEWDCIKTFFPNKKNGSRIIVATQQVETASLCTEQPYQVSELKQLSSDQVLYLYHEKVKKSEMDSAKPVTNSTTVSTTARVVMSTITEIGIQKEGGKQPNGMCGENSMYTSPTVERKLDRSSTRAIIPEDVVERSTEKQTVIDLVRDPNGCDSLKVISVWGMGGIGKTTLVRSVYRSQQLGGWKRAWATALRPFNREVLLRNLALQLQINIQEDSSGAGEIQKKKKTIGQMGFGEMTDELSGLLEKQKYCLIVVDDLSSTQEWDSVKRYLAKASRVIVTTRERNVAKHCSGDDGNMYCLNGLEDNAALDLLKKKVFKDVASFDFELHSGMIDQAKNILKKCDGLPLAVATIGGYLANKPKNATEWRKLNDGLSAEHEVSPELKMIKTVLMRSYDGLPYHLKASFLYLSIFPEDYKIRCKSVVRRWIAEGYAREMQHMSAEQVGDMHFDELLDRSMILPLAEGTNGKIDSCQLHDLIREICMSKAREENLVFTLEEGCNLGSTQRAIRHLAISSNWKRDKEVLQMLDLSHVRSLTVFGEWRSFFISNKMRFLRVLDLEHTVGLRDHHLDQIGELLHLRFLSLRGCSSIFELPCSFANLKQLQTLDVKATRIWALPTIITKLQKLQYLNAYAEPQLQEVDDILERYNDIRMNDRADVLLNHPEKQLKACKCLKRAVLWWTMAHVLQRPQLLEDRLGRGGPYLAEDGVSRHDICNLHRYMIKCIEDKEKLCGVKIPRGTSKLKSLHTLHDVNVAWENATFQELRELTQLRKLGVVGVGKENNNKFWPAIAEHNRLQSLSVECLGKSSNVELDGCLGENLWPPKCLENLKMRGELIKVTEWIHQLQNLSKLQLEETKLNQIALEAIGKLPNLVVLRLNFASIMGSHFRFPGLSFPSLLVLELNDQDASVEFEQHAMPKLGVLQATHKYRVLKEVSGLQYLTSLKEIRLDDGRVKELVQRKLAEYKNSVTLKML